MILLDTHAVLWAVLDNDRMGRRARQMLTRAEVLFVSAVTHAELAIKRSLGKIELPADFEERLGRDGFTPLPLEARHASGLTIYPELHGHDPFDRLLVAQADVDRLSFLTADRALLDLDRSWIVDATD